VPPDHPEGCATRFSAPPAPGRRSSTPLLGQGWTDMGLLIAILVVLAIIALVLYIVRRA
jgi:hypothetical protein